MYTGGTEGGHVLGNKHGGPQQIHLQQPHELWHPQQVQFKLLRSFAFRPWTFNPFRR
jgi:hypothetical protein